MESARVGEKQKWVMRGGYDDCIHVWKVIMEALLCVIIIF